MTELQLFQNDIFKCVRATVIDSEPWFVGADVAKALDYSDLAQAIHDYVDDEDKKYVHGTDFALANNSNKPISKRNITIINESGVYALIFSSRQPRAKEFKRWVTHEVLPSLRRTGQYSITPQQALDDKALEIAKILSEVAPRNLPYIISALKMAGYSVDNIPLLSSAEEGTVPVKWPRKNRHYPIDVELVRMLNEYHKDGLSMSKLADRAFVTGSTLYNVMHVNSNTNPEFARRIKEAIQEIYAEQAENHPEQ